MMRTSVDLERGQPTLEVQENRLVVQVPSLSGIEDANAMLGATMRKVSRELAEAEKQGRELHALVLLQKDPARPFLGTSNDLIKTEAESLQLWEKLMGNLRELRLVLVACVRGVFHELGLALMLACDFRILDETAHFVAQHRAPGIVTLPSLSYLVLQVGMRLSEQALRFPGVLNLEDMVKTVFVRSCPAATDLVAAAADLVQSMAVMHPQRLLLQRRLVNGVCIVERNELKGHTAACNALCVQHAASWDNVTVIRPLLSMEDAMRLSVSGKVLEIHLAPHIRDVMTRDFLLGLDHTLQSLAASTPGLVMAAIHLPSVPASEQDWEDVLVAAELIPQMRNEALTYQERQRAVIQWFLRWERVVDFLQSLPMITVAVLQGPGSPSCEALQLAVGCDFRLARGGVVTRFPARQTLPGVMTFQISKHVGPTQAQEFLLQAKDEEDLLDLRFTSRTTLDAIQGRAGLIPKAVLMPYKRLLDNLWNYTHAELFEKVGAARMELLRGRSPEPDPTPPEGASIDIKYSLGAVSVTFATTRITTRMLQDLKHEVSEITAKALYIYGAEDGCAFELCNCPELYPLWDDLLLFLFNLQIPSIMILNKRVNGNGLALALACSEVLVVEGTTLAVDDLAEGMVPCAPVMELVRSLRVGRMQELLLLGRALSAEEMVQWDLASILVREADAADAGKQVWNAAVAAYGYPPRLRQLRRRLREMAQCEWPKNLLTIKQDKRDAGYEMKNLHGSGSLFVEKEGDITVVNINRPNKANAYDGHMLRILSELISHLEEAGARVVIFQSTDPRFFCAGADAERIANPSARDALQLQSQMVFDKLAKARFMTIAVVEGAAVGGGLEWALACDLRLVGPQSRMFFPETTLGLIPSAGGCTRLTALVGAARAKEMILLGEIINAERAVAWGIAQTADHSADLREYALDVLAAKLVKRPDLALELAKRVIDARTDADQGLLLERVSEAVLYQTKHSPMSTIVATGTAVPPQRFTQHEVADLLGIHDKKTRGLFTASHIVTRHLAEIDQEQDGVTQKMLLDKHLRWAKRLGAQAIDQALQRAGIERKDIKFLAVASSTGFLIPPLTCHLTECMGLSPHIQRADIVGMGCHAGLNVLHSASNWALANPGSCAVMCSIEICSAEYVWNRDAPPDVQMKVAVTNSLFGDGCTAAVVRCNPSPRIGSLPKPLPPGRLAVQLMGFESYIIPQSLDTLYLDWDEEVNKFSFYLTSDVPYAIGEHMPLMINALLDRFGLTKKDIAHWVVHSGGKKVLDSMVYSLGITKHDVRHTVSTLRDYGNISSGAFLLAFERLQREGSVKAGEFGMFVTMGPGAGMECCLFKVGTDMHPSPDEL